MEWSEEIARLQVRMNAETPQDIQAGYQFNAKGIGLVRTEHMFSVRSALWKCVDLY